MRDLSLTHAGSERPSPRRVSFDIHPGEVVLVLGPSGSGKSTLTLALNGLIPHAVPAEISGTVEVAGTDTSAASVAELSTHVAMVFQDPDAQLVTGTVFDEVAFALENLLLPVDEVLARTEDALRRIGLWERRDDNPDRLSGGGRQRLAIACALAMGSPVIVLDEPTANLDPRGIDDVYAALGDLVASGDRAIVLVEHNLDAAMAFATRTIVLGPEGRLAFDGPVADVIRGHTDELLEMGSGSPPRPSPHEGCATPAWRSSPSR
nr:ABC transporter ATP-binding protein [Microbacterium sp. NIBRBAC000506063]